MRLVVQWIALMLLLVGAANAQGWTAFNPEGGRCKVDMPGTPTVETVPLKSPGQTLAMTEAKARAGGATFCMAWVDYPDRIALSASSDVMQGPRRHGRRQHVARREEADAGSGSGPRVHPGAGQ